MEQEIEVLLDLVNAELYVVAADKFYVEGVKLLVEFEEWSDGPPPEALKAIATDLRADVANAEPNSQ